MVVVWTQSEPTMKFLTACSVEKRLSPSRLRISMSSLGQSATFLLSEALVFDHVVFRTELLLLSNTFKSVPVLPASPAADWGFHFNSG